MLRVAATTTSGGVAEETELHGGVFLVQMSTSLFRLDVAVAMSGNGTWLALFFPVCFAVAFAIRTPDCFD